MDKQIYYKIFTVRGRKYYSYLYESEFTFNYDKNHINHSPPKRPFIGFNSWTNAINFLRDYCCELYKYELWIVQGSKTDYHIDFCEGSAFAPPLPKGTVFLDCVKLKQKEITCHEHPEKEEKRNKFHFLLDLIKQFPYL